MEDSDPTPYRYRVQPGCYIVTKGTYEGYTLQRGMWLDKDCFVVPDERLGAVKAEVYQEG